MQEYPKSEVFALLRVERSSYYRWRSREDDPAEIVRPSNYQFPPHFRLQPELAAGTRTGARASSHGDRRRYHISATAVRQMVLYGDLDRSILAACPRLVDPRRYDRKAGDRGVSDDAEPNRTAKGLHHSFGSRRTVRLEELAKCCKCKAVASR